ncbi:hypothetical protein Tco_0550792 [Tanacetum coccineum]
MSESFQARARLWDFSTFMRADFFPNIQIFCNNVGQLVVASIKCLLEMGAVHEFNLSRIIVEWDYMLEIGSSARPRKESVLREARKSLSPNGVREEKKAATIDEREHYVHSSKFELSTGVLWKFEPLQTTGGLDGCWYLGEHEGCTWSLSPRVLAFTTKKLGSGGSVPDPEVEAVLAVTNLANISVRFAI